MEESIKKIELLNQFIANEKRSRQWTVGSIVIFSVLGIVVFVLAYKLFGINENYKKQSEQLAAISKQLEDSNNKLRQDSITQSRNDDADSLTHELESMKALFKSTLLSITDNDIVRVQGTLSNVYQNTFPNNKIEERERIIKSIVDKDVGQIHQEDKGAVYLQFMPDYKQMVPQIDGLLRNQNFNVVGAEQINGLSFNPSVRYFHDEDKETADRIAGLLNSDNKLSLKTPFRSQRMDLKTPLHQVEVWIGDYRPKNFNVQQQYIKGN